MSEVRKILFLCCTLSLLILITACTRSDPNVSYEWSDSWGGEGRSIGTNIAVSDAGDVYVSGGYTGDVYPGLDFSNGGFDLFLSKWDSTGQLKWTLTLGGPGDEVANGMALDSEGNIYITGSFSETVDFSSNPDSPIEHTSMGSDDAFLLKYNPDGTLVWIKTFGGEHYVGSLGLATGNSGEIYVVGGFDRNMNFNPGLESTEGHISNGMYDVFIAKFDTGGNYIWARTWGSTNHDWATAVAVDDAGNAFVTGRFVGTVDFDPGPETDEHTMNGIRDIFLSSFSPDGDYRWSTTIGYDFADDANGIAVDRDGNIFVAGGTQDRDFGNAGGPDAEMATAFHDPFLWKFDLVGDLVWVRSWGGDLCHGVTVDENGNPYVIGVYRGRVDFNPGTRRFRKPWGRLGDVFLESFDSDGNFRWIKAWGSPREEMGKAVALDGRGGIYITGSFEESIDADPTSGEEILTSHDSDDVYVIKLNLLNND